MGSPSKARRHPAQATTSRLSEPSLPLHLALAHLIIHLYATPSLHAQSNPQINLYSSSFTGQILTIIAREVYEVSNTATSFAALSNEVDGFVEKEARALSRRNERLRARGQAVSADGEQAARNGHWMNQFADNFRTLSDGCTYLDILEKDLACRLSERMDDDEEEDPAENTAQPIERRSPLGLFARGLLLTLRKLSFDESSHLALQTSGWCGITPSDSRFPGLATSSVMRLNRKLALNDTLEKRVQAIIDFQNAKRSGDFEKALRSLRRFYDYQFPHAGRGQHQHALLNIAAFHYETGGLESAKSAIDEAIRVARSEGDSACLRLCMSLYHRISTEIASTHLASSSTPRISTQAIPTAFIPKSQTPLDELWSIQTALDYGEAVPTAVRRIHQALARYEQTRTRSDKREIKGGWVTEHEWDEAVWHATQAALWDKSGSTTLSELYGGIAEDVAESSNDARFASTCAKAQRAADKGHAEEAIAVLLDIGSIQDMDVLGYPAWATLVRTIIAKYGPIRDSHAAIDLINASRLPEGMARQTGPGGLHREGVGSSVDRDESVSTEVSIRQLIRKARKMQDARMPPHNILPHILAASELASTGGYWQMYRSSVVALGEVLLEMDTPGMALKARQEVEGVWDQILASDNQDLIARGGLVLAKAKINIALDAGSEAFDTTSDYLDLAFAAAKNIGSGELMTECITLQDIVAEVNNPSLEARCSKRLAKAPVGEGGGDDLLQDIRRVAEIIKLVGVRIAEGSL